MYKIAGTMSKISLEDGPFVCHFLHKLDSDWAAVCVQNLEAWQAACAQYLLWRQLLTFLVNPPVKRLVLARWLIGKCVFATPIYTG